MRQNAFRALCLILLVALAGPAVAQGPVVVPAAEQTDGWYRHPQGVYRIAIPKDWKVVRAHRGTAEDEKFDSIVSPDGKYTIICWRESETVEDDFAALEKYREEKLAELAGTKDVQTSGYSIGKTLFMRVTYEIPGGKVVSRTSAVKDGHRVVINTVSPLGPGPDRLPRIVEDLLNKTEFPDGGVPPLPSDLPTLPPVDEYAVDIPPTQIAPFLKMNEITDTMWAGAVSAAMEGMRLVQGPMSEEETRDFEQAWAPMFDFPFEAGIEYLNKLNPLLGQFLSIRAVMAQTAAEFDVAWREATTATALHQEENIREALAIAHHRWMLLAALQKQLNRVVAEIEALGPPPNPATELAARRKKFRELVRDTKRYLGEKPKGQWVLKKKWTEKQLLEPDSIYPNATSDVTIKGTTVTTTYHNGRTEADLITRSGYRFSWPPMPSIIPVDSDVDRYPTWEIRTERLYDIGDPASPYLFLEVTFHDENDEPLNKQITWEIVRKTIDGREIDWKTGDYRDVARTMFDDRSKKVLVVQRKLFGLGIWKEEEFGTQMQVKIGCMHTINGRHMLGTVYYMYQFDPDGRGPDMEDEGTYPPGAAGDDTDNEGENDSAEEPIDPEVMQEQIDFYKGNISIIEHNRDRDRQELARETDPDRRSELIRRILLAEANIQAEKDRIATLQGGKPVHTRTAWDEAVRARFVEQCQDEVDRFAAAKRYYDGMQRMIGRMEPAEAERLRGFVRRNLDAKAMAGNDMEKIKQVTDAVVNQTQGYWEQRAAESEEAAIDAQHNLEYVKSVKSTCDDHMFVLVLGGGHAPMVAYQGITGFIEGPPPPPKGSPTDPSLGGRIFEGVKRGAMWYNTATFVAAEAVEGYHKGGYLGNEKGGWGAVERAAEAFLLAKSIEYGVGKIFGKPPGPGQPPPKMTVKEQFELAQYKQKLADGLSLVDDYARTYQEYQRVLEFGGRANEIQALEQELLRKAPSLHASMEAKLMMKQMQKQGQNVEAINDFVHRMGQQHGETERRFLEIMQNRYGYDQTERWLFEEFRNSVNINSVGMDYDKALREKGMRFTKQGTRVSIHALNEDAQAAWNEAYRATTGYDAPRSFETFTSSAKTEAYRDTAWIGDHLEKVKLNELSADWAEQAGDVTAFKAHEMMANPQLTRLQGMAEASRGMAKDIDTKLITVMEEAARKTPKNADNIRREIQRWRRIQEVLGQAGENPIEANRQLRLMTGHDLSEVANNLRDMLANYGKAVGRP